MALHWEWSKKCGEMVVKYTEHPPMKLDLYKGNAFLIMIYQDEKEKTYQLWSFFANKDHAKNCLGLTKGNTNIFDREDMWIDSITIYTNIYERWWMVTDLFTRAFDNLTINLTTKKG